jgi:hypothetical protein
VADIREELGLRSVEFGEGGRATAFFFERERIGERLADLAGDQVEERPVFIAERTERIDPRDQDDAGLIPSRWRDRYD